jgi:AAA+ superfamily predicted ATPase
MSTILFSGGGGGAQDRKITRLAFRSRFTRAEKTAIEIAALDNPAAPMAQRQQAAMLRADLADQAQATFIDLDRADTRAGVQALEAAGLLAAGRAAEILDGPVQPQERPA